MKKWSGITFLDVFSVIALIVLVLHYTGWVEIRPRRVTMSWAVIAIQLIFNLGSLLWKRRIDTSAEGVDGEAP